MTMDQMRRFPLIVPRHDLDPSMYQYAGGVDWVFGVAGLPHAIPHGFVFDGASVFTVTGLSWVLTTSPGSARVLWAAMEHDWLCFMQPPGTSSDAAAWRFRKVLTYCRFSRWRVAIMYQAVLRFGPRWG